MVNDMDTDEDVEVSCCIPERCLRLWADNSPNDRCPTSKSASGERLSQLRLRSARDRPLYHFSACAKHQRFCQRACSSGDESSTTGHGGFLLRLEYLGRARLSADVVVSVMSPFTFLRSYPNTPGPCYNPSGDQGFGSSHLPFSHGPLCAHPNLLSDVCPSSNRSSRSVPRRVRCHSFVDQDCSPAFSRLARPPFAHRAQHGASQLPRNVW